MISVTAIFDLSVYCAYTSKRYSYEYLSRDISVDSYDKEEVLRVLMEELIDPEDYYWRDYVIELRSF